MLTNVYITIKWLERRISQQIWLVGASAMVRSRVHVWFQDTRRQVLCSEETVLWWHIESQYYNHLGGKKANSSINGGILVTVNICEVCYSFQDFLLDAEIESIRNIEGNNPPLICHDWFNSNVKIPASGGSSNTQENQGQRGAAKTKKLQVDLQRINNKTEIN